MVVTSPMVHNNARHSPHTHRVSKVNTLSCTQLTSAGRIMLSKGTPSKGVVFRYDPYTIRVLENREYPTPVYTKSPAVNRYAALLSPNKMTAQQISKSANSPVPQKVLFPAAAKPGSSTSGGTGNVAQVQPPTNTVAAPTSSNAATQKRSAATTSVATVSARPAKEKGSTQPSPTGSPRPTEAPKKQGNKRDKRSDRNQQEATTPQQEDTLKSSSEGSKAKPSYATITSTSSSLSSIGYSPAGSDLTKGSDPAKGIASPPPNSNFNSGEGCRVVVEFKRGEDIYASHFEHTMGDMVLVEGDRGKDMGKVIDILPARGHYIASVVAIASDKERDTLNKLRKGEPAAARLCQQRCREHNLPMKVEDVEYQYDGAKLTIYYSSKSSVDFRQLQRQLFRDFRCRVWLRTVPASNS